jgi:hypothetical protein
LKRVVAFLAQSARQKFFCPKESAQPFEKAHFRQGNPRKSKPRGNLKKYGFRAQRGRSQLTRIRRMSFIPASASSSLTWPSVRQCRSLLQQTRHVRAMGQGGQGRDQMDAPLMPFLRRQHRSSSASCARLQSRQFPAHAGDAGTDQGLVADEPKREGDQDRREGRQPRPLGRILYGRSLAETIWIASWRRIRPSSCEQGDP